MTVYVDPLGDYPAAPRIRGKARRWCHLSADTNAELEEFARRIGLREAWVQAGHYDLTGGKRRLAVDAGAQQVTAREMALIRRRLIGWRDHA